MKKPSMELPWERDSWKAPSRLEEARDIPPELPTDLRRMSERQRVDLYNYFTRIPLQELKRRHDVVHAQQSEMHQHLRYYGKNSSYERAVANLAILDDMYRRVIEVLEEKYEEVIAKKFGVERERNFNYRSWTLPQPDPEPVIFHRTPSGVVVGME